MQNDWRSIGDIVPAHKKKVLLAHFGRDGTTVFAIGPIGAGTNCAEIVDDSNKNRIRSVPATHWQFLRSPCWHDW